jgi:hypothetical protein
MSAHKKTKEERSTANKEYKPEIDQYNKYYHHELLGNNNSHVIEQHN